MDIGCQDVGCVYRDNAVGTNRGCKCTKTMLRTGNFNAAITAIDRELSNRNERIKKLEAKADFLEARLKSMRQFFDDALEGVDD